MLAQLSNPAAVLSPPCLDAKTPTRESAPERAALIAPPGLFRDGFAHLIMACFEEIRLDCSDRVEDVQPGAARLVLLAFDPGLRSREALRADVEALRARCDGAPIGVVTPDERAPSAADLGALGVAGVIWLSAGVEVAVAAMRLMSVGGYCLPPEIPSPAARLMARSTRDDAAPGPQPDPASDEAARAELHQELTARERDVLRSLRAGHPNKIIAFELGISESTVKVHLRNIMKKLNASNRIQVAMCGPALFDRNGARARAAVGPRVEPAVVVRRPV